MTSEEKATPSAETLLLAIAALLTAAHQSTKPTISNESSAAILLASVGISHQDIGRITGRQPNAIRMAITRSKVTTSGRPTSAD